MCWLKNNENREAIQQKSGDAFKPGQTILYSKHAQNIDLRLAKEGKPNNKLKHPIKQPYRGLQLRHEPPCLLDNLYIYIIHSYKYRVGKAIANINHFNGWYTQSTHMVGLWHCSTNMIYKNYICWALELRDRHFFPIEKNHFESFFPIFSYGFALKILETLGLRTWPGLDTRWDRGPPGTAPSARSTGEVLNQLQGPSSCVCCFITQFIYFVYWFFYFYKQTNKHT